MRIRQLAAILATQVAAGLVLSATLCNVAWSADRPTAKGGRLEPYEPSFRQRLRSESCLKDEVADGAYCIKRCKDGYQLELKGNKPLCRAR